MKKFFQFAIAIAAVGMMAACGDKATNKEENNEANQEANATEQTAKEEVSRDYDCDYFSVTGLEGWDLKPGSGSLRMEKDGNSITVSNSTISFEKVQENYAKDEKREDMTVAGITWKVFANESSKLYTLVTDIANEPEKALMVKTFKVTPDSPELKAVLETIKLK